MKKNIRYISTVAFGGVLLMPLAAQAQELDNVDSLVQNIGELISALLPIVAGAALLFFFYGLAKYILAAGDEEAKDAGKRIMIGGIIALFLITAVSGIVSFIAEAFDLNQGESITPSGVEDLPNN